MAQAEKRVPDGTDAEAVVSIVAKRLDCEEREETTVEVAPPRGDAGLKAQLIDLVRARYPAAEFRSYADGAASFLAPKVLVVASYSKVPPASAETDAAPARRMLEDPGQEQLFAA